MYKVVDLALASVASTSHLGVMCLMARMLEVPVHRYVCAGNAALHFMAPCFLQPSMVGAELL